MSMIGVCCHGCDDVGCSCCRRPHAIRLLFCLVAGLCRTHPPPPVRGVHRGVWYCTVVLGDVLLGPHVSTSSVCTGSTALRGQRQEAGARVAGHRQPGDGQKCAGLSRHNIFSIVCGAGQQSSIRRGACLRQGRHRDAHCAWWVALAVLCLCAC